MYYRGFVKAASLLIGEINVGKCNYYVTVNIFVKTFALTNVALG